MRIILGIIAALICIFLAMFFLAFLGEDFGLPPNGDGNATQREATEPLEVEINKTSQEAGDAGNTNMAEEGAPANEEQAITSEEGATGSDAAREVLEEIEGEDANGDAAKDIGAETSEATSQATAQATSQAVSTTTGETVIINEENDAIPANIRLFISETSRLRLSQLDLLEFPNDVVLAIWPDSVLIEGGYSYYLLNPPVEIMEAHDLQHITNDEEGFYKRAFDGADGVLLRRIEMMSEANAISENIYAALAEFDKSVVLYSNYADPALNQIIAETELDFDRIDYAIDTTKGQELVEKQWEAIMRKAEHGEELNVLIEANNDGLLWLATAINKSEEDSAASN